MTLDLLCFVRFWLASFKIVYEHRGIWPFAFVGMFGQFKTIDYKTLQKRVTPVHMLQCPFVVCLLLIGILVELKCVAKSVFLLILEPQQSWQESTVFFDCFCLNSDHHVWSANGNQIARE